MGYGYYSHEAHEALTARRAEIPTQQVFKQTACHALMNPKDVRVRESRDSAEHPNSLPIVFALDVTGSMGVIPEQLAKNELPNFMKVLTDIGVTDPQLLFMAVGDSTCDRAPLQVGQFESTGELMDQWLTWTFLERGGGAGYTESYELALYFLCEHIDTDAWVKRKKRSYLFMTGDELPYPSVSKHQVEALIGDSLDEDIPTPAVVATLQETFEPFFLIPDQARRARCEAKWRELLGDHVICLEDPADTCYASAGIVALTEGALADLPALAKRLDGMGVPRARIGRIVRALVPYAGKLGRAGAAAAAVDASAGVSDEPSFWKKLFG